MSPEARPAAIPFEPGSGALPPALEPAIIDSDNPILLLVASETGDAAGRTAVALAETSAERGRETILADTSTGKPNLHELLQVQNLEGLADVFLFGASLERVRTRPPGRAFDFIPMGPYVPEPGAVLESARWTRLKAGLEADGARLLLYVPASSPGLGMLSKRIGQAILVGDPASVERAASRLDRSCDVVAVVEPVAESAPAAPTADEGTVAGAGVAAGEDPEASEVVAEESAELDGEAFSEPELTEPVVFRSDRKSRRAVSPILLLLLIAALVAAGWFLYRQYYAAAETPPRQTPAAASAAEPPADPGEPLETPIRYSVAVEAHQDLPTAQERVEELRRSERDIQFYLAPVVVRGDLYYRLLAGPVTDKEAGDRLMVTLVDRGHKTDRDPWSVLATEHAFLLGEYATREEARTRVDSLAALDVPAYAVPLRYERGPDHYRVYGGAYVTEAEAAVMRDMLTEAGVEARLVARTGEPISEDS